MVLSFSVGQYFVGAAHANYSGVHQSWKLPEARGDRLVAAAKLSLAQVEFVAQGVMHTNGSDHH